MELIRPVGKQMQSNEKRTNANRVKFHRHVPSSSGFTNLDVSEVVMVSAVPWKMSITGTATTTTTIKTLVIGRNPTWISYQRWEVMSRFGLKTSLRSGKFNRPRTIILLYIYIQSTPKFVVGDHYSGSCGDLPMVTLLYGSVHVIITLTTGAIKYSSSRPSEAILYYKDYFKTKHFSKSAAT